MTSIAIDPFESSTVYAGGSRSGVYKSEDGGATWSPASLGLTDLVVTQLVADPSAVERAVDDFFAETRDNLDANQRDDEHR